MMLTIHGLPPYMKYFDIKKIIREECNIMEFLLSNLMYDEDGTKQVKICFIDKDEANLAMKYLEGYRLAGYVLRIVPVGKDNYQSGQDNNDNGFKQKNNQRESDYGSYTEPNQNNQIPWSDKYDNSEPHNKNLHSDLSYVPTAHHLPQPQTEDGDRALVLTDTEINQHTIGPPAQVSRYSHMPYNKQVTIGKETTQFTGQLSNKHKELYQSYDYRSTSPKPCSSKYYPASTQSNRYSYKTAPHLGANHNDNYKKATPWLNTYNRAPMSPMTKPPLFTKPVKRSLIEKGSHNKLPMKIAKIASGPNSVSNKNVYKLKGRSMVATKGNGHKASTQPSNSTVGTGTGSLVSASMQPTRNENAVGVGAWEVESLNGKGKKSKKSLLVATDPIVKPLPAINKRKAKQKNRKQRIKARLQGEMAASVLQVKFPGEVPPIVRSSCVDSGGLPKASGARQPSAKGSFSSIGTKDLTKKLKAAKRPDKNEQFKELEQTKVNANTKDSNLLGVAITCSQTGQLSKEVADKVLADIQKKIITEARNVKEIGSSGPVFKAKPVFSKGVLKLWCSDQKTLQWLKDTVSGLDVPTGVSLVVVQQAEIPKTVRCGIFIPNEQGVWKESHDIVRALVYQNSWVNMERWILARAEEQPNAWFLIFLVPKNQVPILMKAQLRFTCGCGAAYIKFQGRGGKFVDVPPDWNATVTSNEIHNLSSRPDNSQKGVTTTEAGSVPTLDLDKIKSKSIQDDDTTSVPESGLLTFIEPVIESENPQSCSTVSVSESSPLPINDPKVTVSNYQYHHCTASTAESLPLIVIEPVEISSKNTNDRGKLVDARAGEDATAIPKKANNLTIVKSEEDQSCANTCAVDSVPTVDIELEKIKPENTQDDDYNSVASSSVIEPDITPSDIIQNRCTTSVAELPPAVISTFEDNQNRSTSPDVEFVENDVDGNISSNSGPVTSDDCTVLYVGEGKVDASDDVISFDHK